MDAKRAEAAGHDAVPLLKAADADFAKGEPARQELAALRDEATYGRPHEGLIGPDGQPLSNEAIRAHMLDPNRGGGVVNPADMVYMPHTPNVRSARSYFRNWAQRESHGIPSHRWTGEALQKGSFDVHPDTLQAHAANVRGLVDANAGFQDFYRQFGFRPDNPRFQGTYSDMKQIAADMAATTGRDLTPIRLEPWGGSQEQLHQLLDHAGAALHDEAGQAVSPIEDALLRAVDPHGTESGQFGLVDKAVADTMQAHLKILNPNTGTRAMQVLNQGFRRTAR
jgi:hypothetical protein